MDIESLLSNETVKSTLKKFGVAEDKQKAVINQAIDVVKSKGLSNPQALSSLLSSKPNTAADNKFQDALQSDFVKGLISKAGLSDDTAKKISGALPDLLKNIDMGMITSMLASFTGDSGKKGGSSGGLNSVIGMIGNLFKK